MTTLLSTWRATCDAAPDAVAVVDAATGATWSRAQLAAAAADWAARHVSGRDIAGQLVIVAEPNGHAWWHMFLGLLTADAVIAALDPGEPAAVQRQLGEQLGAAWWWTGAELQPIATDGRRWRDGRRIVKLTSGSTGQPRPLPFSDAQMLADGRNVCASMDIRPGDVNLGVIPFGHSYGLGNLVLPLLLQGTALVAGSDAWPQSLAAACARTRPTIFPAVPALLKALCDVPVAAGALGSLRTVISAGAPLAPAVARTFADRFGRRVHSFYGSSETGGITYDRTGDAALTGRSVGTALDGVRLVFERGRRFRVESAAVYTLGARRRTTEGWGSHRPADFAEPDSAGELVLLGRAGRTVKIAGRRVDLGEVELALKKLPGVHDAWVTLHAERADALAAAVATERSPDELRRLLRERLAGWKVPKKLVTLPALPVTRRGKIDTNALRARLGGAGPDVTGGP